MVTTGATPAVAVMIENIKNHPKQTMAQAGSKVAQAGLVKALSKLSPSLSGFAMAGIQGQTAIKDIVQKQYYSNIRGAISAQNHLNQRGEETDGKE